MPSKWRQNQGSNGFSNRVIPSNRPDLCCSLRVNHLVFIPLHNSQYAIMKATFQQINTIFSLFSLKTMAWPAFQIPTQKIHSLESRNASKKQKNSEQISHIPSNKITIFTLNYSDRQARANSVDPDQIIRHIWRQIRIYRLPLKLF